MKADERERLAEDDPSWPALRAQWNIPADVTYLNHGAFGSSPAAVREARAGWLDRLESQPADFFERHLEEELLRTAERLGRFVGCRGEDLILVDNATAAMNIVAASTRLATGDEVLVTDHEYGAVVRLWGQVCDRAGARLVTCPLPVPLESVEQVCDALMARVTPRTRMLVVSHVTSPTATVLPVEAICARAKAAGLTVCVDGPHALVMRPLDLAKLDADFYAASCHKWLSGPFGTGFLYAHPRVQASVRPVLTSWGKPPAGPRNNWRDEFIWLGTRDATGYLALPAAVDFLEAYGVERFRRETHALARYARRQLVERFGGRGVVPDDRDWYGSMVAVELLPGEARALHEALWQRHRIEAPLFEWGGRRLIRVSCHLHTRRADIDRLAEALAVELPA